MGARHSRVAEKDRYAAIIDQSEVTDEVRNIALKYDPLNQQGGTEGFHVTDDGELHIVDEKVIEEHRIVANKIPNDAIQIVRLPAERGELIHQYGHNGFRLYELPAPVEGRVVGVLGENGVGKSTALRILGGRLRPNLGRVDDEPDWDALVETFRGTAVQNFLERLRAGDVRSAYKPQRVDDLSKMVDETVDGTVDEDVDGTVGTFLAARDERDLFETVVSRLDLSGLLDRALADLSGGERQRVAIAGTLVVDADVYLFDEPSSYLDVGQRLTVARTLGALLADEYVLVIDHDLVTLDVLADTVHVLYGEPGGFGVVSKPQSVRRGINQFLEGRLRGENVRIRPNSVDFLHRRDRDHADGNPLVEFPELEKSFPPFSLRVESGTIHEGEVLGVFGQNALGKTTFAKLLAGAVEPDAGTVATPVKVAYKPQHVRPSFDGTVRELFTAEVDVYDQGFSSEIEEPFDLEPLYDRLVRDLSGGELQRVSVALTLARDADLYLLDEPSAYLDVNRRMTMATQLRRFVDGRDRSCLVIDHDLLLLTYVADRAMVFEGEPGRRGIGRSPQSVLDGTNRFLRRVGVTFRRDPNTGRPRANKPGSRKDREQKASGDYYVP